MCHSLLPRFQFDYEQNMFVALDVDREQQCAMMFPATFRRSEIIWNEGVSFTEFAAVLIFLYSNIKYTNI